MHKLCQEYLEKLRLQTAIRLEGERNAFLLREGLYVKEYATDASSPGYPDEEWDVQLGKTRHYRKIPITVTDQEWDELQVAYAASQGTVEAPDNIACNPVALLLKCTALGLYIVSFLIGCFQLANGFPAALLYWGAGFLIGTLFLGIFEIIRQLNRLEKS